MKIRVAGLTDIGCMKIDAISTRGRKRDFKEFFLKETKRVVKDLLG